MPNQNVNHVVINGVTKLDLRSDTVDAAHLAQGYTAHDASGSVIIGIMSGGGSGAVIQDQNGYLVLSDQGGGSSITVEGLNVTQNGTYTAPSGKAYSPVTVSVSGGGGSGGGDMSDPIRFFDYDGTLVASYSSVPSSLPSIPSHTGLTNGAWNYTLQQITTQFNDIRKCDVGANYDTVSGATEIDIELQPERLHPYLLLAVDGTVSIDWGDGSTPTTVSGTTQTSSLSGIEHAYSKAGEYTIKITKTSGEGYTFVGTSTTPFINKNDSSLNSNRAYSHCVRAIRLAAGSGIGNYAFIGCSKMRCISIPSGITDIGTNVFQNCHALSFVAIPIGVSVLTDYIFQNCYLLSAISIPVGITNIMRYAFYNCWSIIRFVIPSGVTTIGSSAFSSCYSVAEYHFLSTTPPTTTSALFSGIPFDCKIYVPTESLTTYQNASYWASYVSYMVGE